MERIHKIDVLIYIFLILALLGLADSVYLAVSYFSGSPLSCETISGCNEVANSPYSKIAGVPISTMGVLYFVIAVAGAFLYLVKRRTVYATLLALLTMIGFAASAYFVYMQVALIKAVCIYCIGSAIAATLMLIVAAIIRGHDVDKHEEAEMIADEKEAR
ncbi:MAG: vitamin K epoxide reductase family protein [Patescibacteria group bacterium]